ncbi:OmpH family outer membrane protein [Haliea sp. E17]|uniref:OmpH family outer membrane protein n=1 Tax=Haliea sp. E17 TaxID=3401576 RepID=UPI003AAE9FB5
MSKLLKALVTTLALTMPVMAMAQGRIAVVNLQEAILQTDLAQKRLEEVYNQDDFKADKAEFDQLKKELDDLVKKFQKDSAVMSQDQQAGMRQKLASKQSDLEHVAGKLKQAEAAAGQALLQEMSPKVQDVLRDLIASEGIGLLMRQEAVIHADAGYSITAKVTDKLNQLTAGK